MVCHKRILELLIDPVSCLRPGVCFLAALAYYAAEVIYMNAESRAGTGSENDDFNIDIQSCSAMDCTGLIPSLPRSEEELQNYNELRQFLPEASKKHQKP